MKKMSTKMLVEAGVMIGLAQVLSYVTVLKMPNGGSVTAGSMVPIMLFAVRWGMGPGIIAGTVYGIMQFLLGPMYSFHPISILFDYVVAFGMLGLAGLFRKSFIGVFAGIIIAIFGRFVCHVISGVIVFASYTPAGSSPIAYSIVYNGSYLIPEMIITVVIVALLYKPLIQRLGIN